LIDLLLLLPAAAAAATSVTNTEKISTSEKTEASCTGSVPRSTTFALVFGGRVLFSAHEDAGSR